jgi:hypothetical protein
MYPELGSKKQNSFVQAGKSLKIPKQASIGFVSLGTEQNRANATT